MLESFEGQMLLQLQDYIIATVPEIKWVDQDLGQLEDYEIRPAVSFPCVLIDFQQTTFAGQGEQVQEANATILFRLGFAPFSNSNSATPKPVREMAVKYYELEMRLYQALQGWYGVDAEEEALCQPMTRTMSGTEKREDSIRVRATAYTTYYEDHTAQIQYDKVPRPKLKFK